MHFDLRSINFNSDQDNKIETWFGFFIPIVIHIKKFMGAFIIYLFFGKPLFIGPSSIFLEHLGVFPYESTSLDPNWKIETKVFPHSPPFQFIYMGVELWANNMG